VAVKGVGEVGNGLACLTPVLVCIGIAFSPYVVAVSALYTYFLSETENSEEGIEKVFGKRLWRVNGNFLNAFRKMLFFEGRFMMYY
jgi:hypothetical protein